MLLSGRSPEFVCEVGRSFSESEPIGENVGCLQPDSEPLFDLGVYQPRKTVNVLFGYGFCRGRFASASSLDSESKALLIVLSLILSPKVLKVLYRSLGTGKCVDP